MNNNIQEESTVWAVKNKEKILEKYILEKDVSKVSNVAFFMAGSPGSGKTEFADWYIKQLDQSYGKVIRGLSRYDKNLKEKLFLGSTPSSYEKFLAKIDIDEIREFIPHYRKTNVENGVFGNSHEIQRAANIILDYVRNYCIENQIPFLLDGTFGNQFSTFEKIIKKLKQQDRYINIFFIYINPLVAWDFTKKREHLEGRNITKKNFINQYFQSIKNIKRVKERFGESVLLNLVIKNDDSHIEKIFFNRNYEDIERLLKERYNIKNITEKFLEENLKE